MNLPTNEDLDEMERDVKVDDPVYVSKLIALARQALELRDMMKPLAPMLQMRAEGHRFAMLMRTDTASVTPWPTGLFEHQPITPEEARALLEAMKESNP